MISIMTNKGKKHEVAFCGISSLTGALVFQILIKEPLEDYVEEFFNSDNLQSIFYDDEYEGNQTYIGYVDLLSFSRNVEQGTIQIMLRKE